MKICITSRGKDLQSELDPRFGRAVWFIFYDTESDSFTVHENKAASGSGGAGIEAGTFLSDNSINVLITGNVGPNAWQTLQAAGISTYIGINGKVEDSVSAFKKNRLTKIDKASVDSHYGMK